MPSVAAIADVLGGKGVLKVKVQTAGQLGKIVKLGLPVMAFRAVMAGLQVEQVDALRVVHLPPTTYARRVKSRRLAPDESDRLVRVARIVALAEEVFGRHEKASGWLKRPNRALSGEAPFNLLETDPGSEEVENLLIRVAHGIPS